jgi:hypothetical protein
MVSFQEGSGWVNPHTHLISCLCNGIEAELEDHYWNAVASSTIGTPKFQGIHTSLHSAFAAKTPTIGYQIINQRERDMFAWILMIVMENLPLSSVVNERYRAFAKPQTHFGIKTVRNVILAMTLSIEEKLKAEIAAAGNLSIVHDAWSKFGEHYFALFATYIAT